MDASEILATSGRFADKVLAPADTLYTAARDEQDNIIWALLDIEGNESHGPGKFA